MADEPDRIVIGADGSLSASPPIAQQLRERSGVYRVTVSAPGLIILRQDPRNEGTGVGARVMMAGEILTRMTMLEVVSAIANASWRGELHVINQERTHRALTLDRGALKYGRSNHSDDRLGEVLYRNGLLSRRDLRALLEETTPDRRFGQLVVEQGYLEQEQLFALLQKQVEQIFFAALLAQDGTYVFATAPDSGPPPSHTVHIPIQGLLMEGVQRIDEMTLFRERIPSSQMCPAIRHSAPPKKLDATAQALLEYCDGSRTIEEIARQTGLGEFHTTKSIYHLLQQGQVTLHMSPSLDEEAVRKLVHDFNEIMRDILVAVATYGGVDRTRTTVSTWIVGSGFGPFLGVELDEDGSIDADFVAASLRRVKHDRPLEALHQALHELVAFALFSATTTLPRDQEIALARDVNRRLKTIRI